LNFLSENYTAELFVAEYFTFDFFIQMIIPMNIAAGVKINTNASS